MLRVLLRPRWAAMTLLALAVAAGCVVAGMWQLDRHRDRVAANAIVTANVAREPVPLGEVLPAGQPVGAAQQWRTVLVRGRYDADAQLLLRLRSLDGRAGSHVLTPLVTESGSAVLVDRGWTGDTRARVVADLAGAAPPAGEVEALVRLRASETGRGLGGDPDAGSIRTVDVALLDEALPYDVVAWADLVASEPAEQSGLTPVPPPGTGIGPHLAYSVQWFLFGAVALIGYGVLVRAEVRGGPRVPAVAASPAAAPSRSAR